jgi:polyisoprenoid-binding protein YceI
MKKYFLFLLASGILITVTFLQCTSSASTNPETANQMEAEMSGKATESSNSGEPTSLESAGFTLKLLKATINGTSSLHDWESQITGIEGKGLFQTNDKSLATIQDAEIKIAVTGIKSTEGKKMDNNTYEAFQSDKNPFIIYSFSRAAVKISGSHAVTIEVTGKLSMAGTSKPVSLMATGKELPNGDLHLSVSKKIKMTDYNMKPPVMFLGTIKVGDEITVNFDLELTKL